MAALVARIVLDLHDDGSLQVQGNIGDKRLALGMIDGARNAVEGIKRMGGDVLVPPRDAPVLQDPAFPFGPLVRP